MLNRTSPLRIEINPWTLDSTLHDVMQLRGTYVAAFGTVETILTELAIRASKVDSYSKMRAKFPSRRPDRLSFLESLCDVEGPLSPCAGIIRGIIVRFRDGMDLRDMLAHGRMQILSGTDGNANLKLEDYRASGEAIAYRLDNRTLKSLRIQVYKAALLSRSVDRLYLKLGERLPLLSGAYQGTEAIL